MEILFQEQKENTKILTVKEKQVYVFLKWIVGIKLWYICTMEYYLAVKKKKEGNLTLCNSMDRHGELYAK